jgi:hypothetical protein
MFNWFSPAGSCLAAEREFDLLDIFTYLFLWYDAHILPVVPARTASSLILSSIPPARSYFYGNGPETRLS